MRKRADAESAFYGVETTRLQRIIDTHGQIHICRLLPLEWSGSVGAIQQLQNDEADNYSR
jgi:hypothetical protein